MSQIPNIPPIGGAGQGKIYEMLWDCQFCGSKGLLGKSQRFCPNCGAPQNPDSRYYPSDEQKIEAQGYEYVGADVTCPACKHLNSGKSEFCEQCGSPLKGGQRANTLGAESRAQGESFAQSARRDVVKEKHDAEMKRVGVIPDEKQGSKRTLYIILGVIALIVVGVVVFFSWQRESSFIVTGHTWERTIYVEQYSQFVEQNWRDSRPFGDRVTMGSCVQRQRTTRQVPDGETCTTVRTDRGDGSFSEQEVCSPRYRSEPVYDDWCTFTGFRWQNARQVVSNGVNLSPAPAWGELTLRCANQSSVGCERESGRDENYIVKLKAEGGRDYECGYDNQATWQSFNIESLWKGNVRVVDGGLDCASLKQ